MKKRLYMWPLLALLAVALSYEGLVRYNRFLDRRDNPGLPPAAAAVTPAPRPERRQPEAFEIAALESTDYQYKRGTIEVLMTRQFTPELIAAVEKALSENQPAQIDERLRCLKMHFPGEANFEMAMRAWPDAVATKHWKDGVEIFQAECLIEAIVQHADENPDRVRAALVEAAQNDYPNIHHDAVVGLRTLAHAEEIPLAVRVQAASPDVGSRLSGLETAMALGAVDLMPGLIERALDDEHPNVAGWMCGALAADKSPAAARMFARALAHKPDDRDRRSAFRSRERKDHELSTMLAEVAADSSTRMEDRVNALKVLGADGDASALPLIDPLRRGPNAELSAPAQAAGVQIEQRASRIAR